MITLELLILLGLVFIYRGIKKMPSQSDLDAAIGVLQASINAAAARVIAKIADPVSADSIAAINASAVAADQIAPE